MTTFVKCFRYFVLLVLAIAIFMIAKTMFHYWTNVNDYDLISSLIIAFFHFTVMSGLLGCSYILYKQKV